MRSKSLAYVSILLITLVLLLPGAPPSLADSNDSWSVVSPDFGTNSKSMHSMAVFNSDLYVGLENTTTGGQVWRFDGSNWSQVSHEWDTANSYAYTMAVYNSKLYVGTHCNNASEEAIESYLGCEIWCYDGNSWTQVNTDGFGDKNNKGALSMAVLDGKLYVGTWNIQAGCGVWRFDEVNNWTSVNAGGFGDKNIERATSMAVFNGKLYVGADDAEVWRFDEVNNWTQVNDSGFGEEWTNRIDSMTVFDSKLYASTSWEWIHEPHGCRIWSYDGNSWTQVNALGFGDLNNRAVMSMVEFDSKLYAGAWNQGAGCEVWCFDGSAWSQVNAGGFGDPVNNSSVGSMAPFDSKLYVGSFRNDLTPSNRIVEILGSQPLPTTGINNADDDQVSGNSAAEDARCSVWRQDSTQPLIPTFYFAEGSCRPDFDPYICIQNPGDSDAEVKITYMKGDGITVEQDVTVIANSRSTVTVKDKLGEADDAAHDFSAKVESTNLQPIICERPMYFNYNGVWAGGHDVVGALAPCKTFFFAEGTCRPGFDPYICIQNPGNTNTEVKITYMKGDGSTDEQTLAVKANSRSTVKVKDKLGEADDEAHDFSAKVASMSDQGIICERPMYFAVGAQGGGHDVVGALAPFTTFYFAEGTCRPGFTPYICIQNPGDAGAEVKITYMKGDGTTDEEILTVGAKSRSTVAVKDKLGEGEDAAYDFSAKVESTNGQGILAERPMYFDIGRVCGGHDVGGALSPGATFYFAEGTCRPGFTPYICIQNPGDAGAEVKITYMKGDGTTDEEILTVNANSRHTVIVKDKLGEGDNVEHDFSAKVECTNNQMIVVERPMYFEYNEAIYGGSDVVGFMP